MEPKPHTPSEPHKIESSASEVSEIIGLEVDVLLKFLILFRDHYSKCDKATSFIESRTGVSNISAITNLRDALSHFCTALQPETPPEKRVDQYTNAEEHFRRAIIEPFELALEIELAKLEKLYVKYKAELIPVRDRYEELEDSPTESFIDSSAKEIKQLQENARIAKARNRLDEAWEKGVSDYIRAVDLAESLYRRMEGHWNRLRRIKKEEKRDALIAGLVKQVREQNEELKSTKSDLELREQEIQELKSSNDGQTFIIKETDEIVNDAALISEIESIIPKLKEKAAKTGLDGDFAAVSEALRALESAKTGDTESALRTIAVLKPRLEEVIIPAKDSTITQFYLASDEKRAHIETWEGSLHHEEFLIECRGIEDIEQKNILKNLERYGICQIRLQNQPPEEYVLESTFKLIGQPANRQNDFVGIIKNLKPEPGIEANTGSSTGDLGFHFDGTQHEHQPAVLIFQYVVGATLGGNSKFVDAARILADIDLTRREDLLVNLAQPDAATFSKKGMQYVGPVFSFPDNYSLACRIRYDSVLTISPKFEEDYNLLKAGFMDPRYHMLFKPRPGDIILFDNWRVAHARDEIYSTVQRHHRRTWLEFLRLELQSRYQMGIRPISDKIKARIKEANGL